MTTQIKKAVLKSVIITAFVFVIPFLILYNKFHYGRLAKKLDRACSENSEVIVYLPDVLGYDYDTIYYTFGNSIAKLDEITHCGYEDVGGRELDDIQYVNEYLFLLICSNHRILEHTAEYKGYPEKCDHTEHPGEIDLDSGDPKRDTLKYYRTSAKYFKLLHVIHNGADYFKLTDIPDSVKK